MEKVINLHKREALQLIEKFSPAKDCKWSFEKLNKDEFILSLKKMIENPHAISQGVHPLCGIASLLKVAAELDPVGLVKLGAHLFANGSYQTPSFLYKKVKAPKSVRKMKNYKGLSPAEHVLETTIKSFYNPLTGYNNKPGSLFNEWQGITFPHQLANFLKSYFKIERVTLRTFLHSVDELDKALKAGVSIMAWTSWNQMINPGGKFRLLHQHYVILKKIERIGNELHVVIDNPRKNHDKLQVLKFQNESQFYKAVIGVYGFKRKG